MTDFCPKCGKKAEKDEELCSVCGEKITSLSQEKKNNRKNKIKINILNKIIFLILLVSVLYLGIGITYRYFNAGKNIESNKNNQKSELKILKDISGKYKEDESNTNIKSKKNIDLEKVEQTESKEKATINKKEKYLKMMNNLDIEVEKTANLELDGGEEKLLDYTSKIYKKYDTVLNMIYQEISSKLDSEKAQELKEDEIEWINKKDEIASKAVGSDNTTESEENWVYFDSLATSTKERCYYLINTYMN